MTVPDSIKFTSLTLKPSDLQEVSNSRMTEVAESEWARVTFTVPTAKDAVQDVMDWLKSNCTGQFSSYRYYDNKNYSNYKMVVRFESKNDAIIFKLQDGHKVWENKGKP